LLEPKKSKNKHAYPDIDSEKLELKGKTVEVDKFITKELQHSPSYPLCNTPKLIKNKDEGIEKADTLRNTNSFLDPSLNSEDATP